MKNILKYSQSPFSPVVSENIPLPRGQVAWAFGNILHNQTLMVIAMKNILKSPGSLDPGRQAGILEAQLLKHT